MFLGMCDVLVGTSFMGNINETLKILTHTFKYMIFKYEKFALTFWIRAWKIPIFCAWKMHMFCAFTSVF